MKKTDEYTPVMDGYKYAQTYTKLILVIVDRTRNPNGIGCGYYYLVQGSGASGHTAFRTKEALRTWLKSTGLKIGNRLVWGRSVWLDGQYTRSLEMLDTKDFFQRYAAHCEPVPVLDNGDYTIGFKEQTENGVILHVQNCNSDRWSLSHRETDNRLDGMNRIQAKYSR